MGTRKYFCPIKKYIPLKDLFFNCFYDSQVKLPIIVTIHPALFDNCINCIRRKLKMKTTRIKSIECPFVTKIKRERELVLILPSHSQDLISNSPYCLPYNSYYVSSESLVLDQLTKGREQLKVLIVCSSHCCVIRQYLVLHDSVLLAHVLLRSCPNMVNWLYGETTRLVDFG